MTVNLENTTSSEYETEANRLRAQIAAKIDALNERLTPSNIASEVASQVGIADVSWSSGLAYASKRHPLPTAIIGLGVGIWAFSALRPRSGRESVRALAAPARRSAEAIVNSRGKGAPPTRRGETASVRRCRTGPCRNGSRDVVRCDRKTARVSDRSGARRQQHSALDRVFNRGCPRGRPRGLAAEILARLSIGASGDSLTLGSRRRCKRAPEAVDLPLRCCSSASRTA